MTTKKKAVTARGGRKLTPKREAFVLAVVSGMTQADAYRSAFSTKNMKPETVQECASRLMSDRKVIARFMELSEQATSAAVMTRQEALERLSLIAMTRITDILDFETVEIESIGKDGEPETKSETIWRMKESSELQERAAAAIKSVTMTKFGPKIEMHDARDAIQQLARMQGWDSATRHEHTGKNGGPIETATLTKEEYKQARKEMLADDDC